MHKPSDQTRDTKKSSVARWIFQKILLSVFLGSFSASPAFAILGDVNGDGKVDIQDAQAVANYLIGNTSSLPHPEDADVNGDGKITTADALLILQFASGLRTSFGFQVPQVLAVMPGNGATGVLLTVNVSVFFSAPISSASLAGTLTLTDTTASQLVSGTLHCSQDGIIETFFPAQPLQPLHSYRVDVTTAVVNTLGTHLGQSFSSTFQTQALGSLVLVSVNNATAAVNSLLNPPITVKALSASAAPVPQVAVLFTAQMGAGTFQPSGLRQVTVLTDNNGMAQAGYQLGGQAMQNTVAISAVGFSSAPLFSVATLPNQAVNLRVYSGANQNGGPGGIAPFPLIVQATDAGGNAVLGTTVTFSVTQGQGNFSSQPTASVPTDSSGTASTFFTFGGSAGPVLVQATFNGMSGQPPVFNLMDLIPQPSSPTAIVGTVIDAQTLQPLSHVYVYIVDNPSIWDWTDQSGSFTLTVSSGPHVVEVDGFESGVINGQMYPVVSIPVNAVQGQNNSIGMPALLPELDSQSFLDVSAVQGGTLTLRANPLWQLYVAPGSAHFVNGTTSGRLYVASVPADKIPMPAAGGKISRFFDTIQPLNVQFNPPAQVSFPNADNLPPGTMTDIFTLSYASGTFQKTGRGLVSQDGSAVQSLPGQGITAGGWHMAAPPQPLSTFCLKAALNLGANVLGTNLTSFGLSSSGVQIAPTLWNFALCNLPSTLGPVSPILSANFRSGFGPSISSGPLPPSPTQPPQNPGPVQSISLAANPANIYVNQAFPHLLIAHVTTNSGSSAGINVTFQAQPPNLILAGGQTFGMGAITVQTDASGNASASVASSQVGPVDVTASVGTSSSTVTLIVFPETAFEDGGANKNDQAASAFDRTTNLWEIAVNVPGSLSGTTNSTCFNTTPPQNPNSVAFTFPTSAANVVENGTCVDGSRRFNVTASGNAAATDNFTATITQNQTTQLYNLGILTFDPKPNLSLAVYVVDSANPLGASISNIINSAANIFQPQVNIGFALQGSVQQFTAGLGSIIDLAAEQQIVNSSFTPTANVNVYFINRFDVPDLGQEITISNNQQQRPVVFIAGGFPESS